MRITFLGHQGWRFENNGRSFLLDPILEEIGNGAVRLPVWPQRRLDFAKLEPIDAVVVSHEHADHFSLETLQALPRRCRIYICDLSSFAMSEAIRSLGFQVERFSVLRPFTIAGIQVTALPALYNTLEPDTYALLMQDESGASFLTAIDTVPHPDIFAWLARHCPVRTLDNLTNNFVEPRQPLVRDPAAHTKSRAMVAGHMLDFVRQFAPQRAVVSGQGWSFKDAKAKLNHSFFSVDNSWLTQTARELAPHVQWFEGAPGMRFTLNGADVAVDRCTAIEASRRPSREFIPSSVRDGEPYGSWTGSEEISAERLKQVRRFIVEEYGQILGAYAPKLMEGLYYLKCQDDGNLAPAFGVTLRNGAARYAFQLDYGQLSFREIASRSFRPAALGVELWASDLELLLGAQEEVFLVYESAVRPWSFAPGLIEETALIESFMWFTPRFRPHEFLSFYLAQIAAAQGGGGEVARV